MMLSIVLSKGIEIAKVSICKGRRLLEMHVVTYEIDVRMQGQTLDMVASHSASNTHVSLLCAELVLGEICID